MEERISGKCEGPAFPRNKGHKGKFEPLQDGGENFLEIRKSSHFPEIKVAKENLNLVKMEERVSGKCEGPAFPRNKGHKGKFEPRQDGGENFLEMRKSSHFPEIKVAKENLNLVKIEENISGKFGNARIS